MTRPARILAAAAIIVAITIVCPILTTASSSLGWASSKARPSSSIAEQIKPLTVQASESLPPLTNPDLVCATCHQAIYARYEQTPMAQGSGPADTNLIPGAFRHTPSNIDYRIFLRDSTPYMSFSRDGNPPLSGERKLLYFIGSGRRGRTYLYRSDTQWFELPINSYTRRNTWDMAPAFDAVTSMPAVLPTDPNCLHCHATDVQPSLPTARNRFAAEPFRQGGIGCSACHGDPTAHLAQSGHGPILNPNKLSPAKRDSACIQCHLEGDAVVYKPGRSLAQFRPGEDLAATAVYFIRASHQAGAAPNQAGAAPNQSGAARATSQYEALLRSACKRATGDRLTCTTCHDPHSTPAPAERVQFFRARCLACHTSPKLAATHHPEQPDCALCHMPTRPTTDISHEQLTDHDIESRPTHLQTLAASSDLDKLVTVGGVPATEAEYGMAYAQLAAHGNAAYAREALRLLTHAASLQPDQAPLAPEAEVQLAYLRQRDGHPTQARANYINVLRQLPYEPTALANLGVLDASTSNLAESLRLLNRLIDADPSHTAAGLNLAFIDCSIGRKQDAQAILKRLADINPDDPQLRIFQTQGTYAGQHCALTIP
ncbi:tetratricopeptide repeat protein [Granulicella tundricola]|uniref:TPR repeat-containing protein n=1 Tax=Granulicella tundricola (strain ATCC BAA-1859 / DSM 23138 / MP5ACTX9) TaxID=1198114 RepID=E8X6I0_GRATM|nr:tetratricopeptide repeat protein [Granulicella tundricola]ADW71064.1 TPR repeat-containing protein [Granulicella tundricola MP5ACTX9]